MKTKILLMLTLIFSGVVNAKPLRLDLNGNDGIFIAKAPPIKEEAPVVLPDMKACPGNNFLNFFSPVFDRVVKVGKAIMKSTDPCEDARDKGADMFCRCVNEKAAQQLMPYNEMLSKVELEKIQKEIVEKDKAERLAGSLNLISKALSNALLGQGITYGCSIKDMRETLANMNCSQKGKQLIIDSLLSPDAKKEFLDATKGKGALIDLLDTEMYRHIKEITATTAKKKGGPVMTFEEYKKYSEDDEALPKLLVTYEYDTPGLLKKVFKDRSNQASLRELKDVLAIPENSWGNYFTVSEEEGGKLLLTLNVENIQKARSLRAKNGRGGLSLNLGKNCGGTDEEQLDCTFEDEPDKIVDAMVIGRGLEDLDQECERSKDFIEKICKEDYKFKVGDIVDKCFSTKKEKIGPLYFENRRKEFALCKSFTGQFRQDEFFQYFGEQLGSTAELSRDGVVSDTDSTSGLKMYGLCPEQPKEIENKLADNSSEASTVDAPNSTSVGAQGLGGFSGIFATTNRKEQIFSDLASSYIGSKSISKKEVTNTLSAIQAPSNLESFIPEKINTKKPIVEEAPSDWSQNFAKGADAKLPGQNEWDNYKEKLNVPQAVEQKYEQLKAEDTEINDREKELAGIESRVTEKKDQLDAAIKAFEDKKDAQAKADLQKLKDEFAGLQGELESSKKEISKLREKHQGNVESFKTQVASIAPTERTEASRPSTSSFTSGNNVGSSRANAISSERADEINSGAASTPSNNSRSSASAGRSAMAVGSGGSTSRNSGASGTSSGSSSNNPATITLSSEFIINEGTKSIEINGIEYEVKALISGEIILKNGENYYIPDSKTKPKKLLPVDKEGKPIALKRTAESKKPNIKPTAGRAPAAVKDRKRYRLNVLENALK
jgi:hypothetical protein